MKNKKNRQSSSVDIDSGTNDENLPELTQETSVEKSKCGHYKNTTLIRFPALKKKLAKRNIGAPCEDCELKNPKINPMDADDKSVTAKPSQWICLHCGKQHCDKIHTKLHFEIPHNNSHNLMMNTKCMEVYCFKCEGIITFESQSFLRQLCEYIKNLSTHMETSQLVKMSTPPPNEKPELNTLTINNTTNKQPPVEDFTKVSGLTNFGNTCFFNSVLQCLAQTPYLVETLQNLKEEGEKFRLPGGKVKISNENKNEEDSEYTLEAIEGSLSGWGNFTSKLTETLISMQYSTDSKTHGLRELRDSFKNQSSQCMDGGQHDSHELLRHLLELVRTEDLKRYQSVILDTYKKKSRKNGTEIFKKEIKFYGNQASARLLGPEPVFRGELVSTLECLKCKHSSQRTEPFLDLSLPVTFDKSQSPTVQRKNYYSENNDFSKLNFEKSKIYLKTNCSENNKEEITNEPSEDQLKKEKLNAKIQMLSKMELSNKSLFNNSSICEDNQENSGDKMDLEPNNTSQTDFKDEIENEANLVPNVIESECDSEKIIHLNSTESVTLEKSSPSSEVETGECHSSPETEHPVCESPIANVDEVTTGLSKILIPNNITLPSSSPRYPVAEGELSIQSCLNQFTALELMDGRNAVACEACTAKANKENENNSSSKMIYTPSTKQDLISRVPPVLILHLLRFQSRGFGFRKITKHVGFPMVLDLAPVCKNNKEPKLYSLFGLIEHSGTLHNGHYVAYVKARQPLHSDNRRWSFLPKKNSNENNEKNSGNSPNDELEDGQNSEAIVEPPPGQWYYTSDSRVVAVSETEVLKREAYLLFYERIQ